MNINELITKTLSNKPRFSNQDAFKGIDELNSMQNVMQLIIYHYDNIDYPEKADLIEAVHKAFQPVLFESCEPSFDNGHCWGYPVLCDCICLIKNNPELWNSFSEEEKARFDAIMHMFALMWNFGCNKYNYFNTGIGLKGNFRKDYNPNYKLTNDMLMPFLINYFGSVSEINRLFTIDHDSVIAILKEYRFRNALSVWNRPEITYKNGTIGPSAKFLYSYKKPGEGNKESYHLQVEDYFGNKLAWGYGAGCQIPAAYMHLPEKTTLNLNEELIKAVLDDCFAGGKCISRIFIENEGEYAECNDSTISPYEGREGMMYEFNCIDSYGLRSSLWHCELDFILVYMHIIALKYLNILDITTCDEWSKINVGMNDFIFKYQNNYKGYSMGNYEDNLKNIESDFWIKKWINEVGDDING